MAYRVASLVATDRGAVPVYVDLPLPAGPDRVLLASPQAARRSPPAPGRRRRRRPRTLTRTLQAGPAMPFRASAPGLRSVRWLGER